MQARFLIGPAGSGKTYRCLEEIRSALRENPEGLPLILIAPKQATFQLERQLLAGASIAGYTRLQILSFDRLARFIMEEHGVGPPESLSEEGRVMVLRALLQRHGPELKLFGRSARRAGFAQEIGALLGEFRQHHVSSARLRALAEGNARELGDKLLDLALLQDRYAEWLEGHGLQDANHWLDAAIEVLRRPSRRPSGAGRISGLWLDGFAEMTPQELDLLAAVAPLCDRATLAFCLDEAAAETAAGGASWLSIWSAVGRTFSRCRERLAALPGCRIETEILPRHPRQNRFAQNAGLAQLEQGWAKMPHIPAENRQPPGAVSIWACADAEAEAHFAAREILKFVRAGNRFRDCAVLVRNLEDYHQPLSRIFRRCGIPCFPDRREPVAHHPLAELTRGALRTVAFDWRQEDWFAALKAAFTPVDGAEIDRLENAALEFGWRGGKWREPLPDRRLEGLREKIMPPFAHFAARLGNSKSDGAQLAEALRGLWGELRVEEVLERWTAEEGAGGQRAHHAALHSTVLDQMESWLDNLALAFRGEPLPLRDWLPVVEAGLAGLTVGVIPPVLDEVLIGAVDRARNPDLKLALVLGVNETVFPAAPVPATILTEDDRDELQQSGVALGSDLRERLARERYYGYIACTRASEKLALTFARRDADGRAMNPSPFIRDIQRIFPGLETGNFSAADWREAAHTSELAAPLTQIGTQPAGNWAQLLEIPAVRSLAENLRRLREPAPDEMLSPALAERLFGPTLRTSVSRLEEFAQCPFRFYVRSALRAGERKIFELDARERGSFQHEVLKKFHDELAAERRRWRDLLPAEARERIRHIATGLAEDFRTGLMRDTAEARFEAHMMTEALEEFIEVVVTWMRGQYEFDPAAAELGFGGDAPTPAWEMDLGGGRRLALQGRIDRVDLCRRPDGAAWCAVMDYKSGFRKPDAVLIEHGVQLQLPAYLNTLRRWKNPREPFGVEKLAPAGFFYVNLRGQFENGKTRDEVLTPADSRKAAYRHNGRFNEDAMPQLDRADAKDQFNQRQKMPRAEFDGLLDRVEERLREMGLAIFSGEAKVDPYRKGKATPCPYCDYHAICRIDPWTHQYRVLRAGKKPGDAAASSQ